MAHGDIRVTDQDAIEYHALRLLGVDSTDAGVRWARDMLGIMAWLRRN